MTHRVDLWESHIDAILDILLRNISLTHCAGDYEWMLNNYSGLLEMRSNTLFFPKRNLSAIEKSIVNGHYALLRSAYSLNSDLTLFFEDDARIRWDYQKENKLLSCYQMSYNAVACYIIFILLR